MYIIKLQFKFIPCFVFLSLVQMGAILLRDKGRRRKGKVCLVEWSHEGPRWNYGKEQSRWGELKCNLMQHSNEIQAYEHTAVCMVDREDDKGKRFRWKEKAGASDFNWNWRLQAFSSCSNAHDHHHDVPPVPIQQLTFFLKLKPGDAFLEKNPSKYSTLHYMIMSWWWWRKRSCRCSREPFLLLLQRLLQQHTLVLQHE